MVNTYNMAIHAGKPWCSPARTLANTTKPDLDLLVVKVKQEVRNCRSWLSKCTSLAKKWWEMQSLHPTSDLPNLKLREWGLAIWVSPSTSGDLMPTHVWDRGIPLACYPGWWLSWRPESISGSSFLARFIPMLCRKSHILSRAEWSMLRAGYPGRGKIYIHSCVASESRKDMGVSREDFEMILKQSFPIHKILGHKKLPRQKDATCFHWHIVSFHLAKICLYFRHNCLVWNKEMIQ